MIASVYLTPFLLYFFSSGEEGPRQLLAPCPQRLPDHSSTNALPQINQLPGVGGGVSSDHLHFARPRGPGAAAAMPRVLDPQRRRLPASGCRVQDVVPACWPGSSSGGRDLRHERMSVTARPISACLCFAVHSPLLAVASCRPLLNPLDLEQCLRLCLYTLFVYAVLTVHIHTPFNCCL